MMFRVKFIESFIITSFFLVLLVNSIKLENRVLINKYKYEVNKNFTLPEGPVFAKGWLKYTSFIKNDLNKPKEFSKNKAFFVQMKGFTLDLSRSDDVGYINIPDGEHFFFILTENNLNVLSSRKKNLAATVDTLRIKDILAYEFNSTSRTKDKGMDEFEGEILDHGDFSEGYCFQIKSLHWKNKKDLIWEFCADSRNHKIMWMNTLYSLIKKFTSPSNSNSINRLLKEPNNAIIFNHTNLNVTWVPITKWSACTEPCGGGKSYLQRLCIIPQDVSEKCEGEMLLERSCNLESCDTFDREIAKYNMTRPRAMAQINYIPVNQRPMRYEKCKLKDGDLALYIDEGTIKGAKIPVRVILNKNTLTAYANDSFDSIILSHKLSAVTGLRKYDKDNSNACFEIEEKKRKTILCAFVPLTNKSIVELAKEWQVDILDFIKKCTNSYSPDLDYVEIEDEKHLDKLQNVLDFYQENEKNEMDRIILKTQQIALQAIEKEIKVENLIEKEEESKQRDLEEKMIKKFEEVRLQKELISKALMEKKKQADIFANKLSIKKKIKQITDQVKREVLKIREDLKSRITAKQRDESRKRELVLDKINDLKKDISNDLLKASKNGKIEECNPDRKNEEIRNYCKVNYAEDFKKMNQCVEKKKYCYMCCESEFGDLHLENRSSCISKCDDYYIYNHNFDNTEREESKEETKTEKQETKEILIKKNSENSKKEKVNSVNLVQLHESKSNKSKQDIEKLIEEAKKKELLMNIKEELLI